jgi:hypothetical protein
MEELNNLERKLQTEENKDRYDGDALENMARDVVLQRRMEEKTSMQEDLINNEIDVICNRTLENYIEP